MSDKDIDNNNEEVQNPIEDVEFVEEFDSAASGLQSKTRHVLKGELKKTQKERQEYLEGWQRAKADLANAKREFEERSSHVAKFASEDLMTELLPVLDSFDMAFRDKEAWEKADENWRKGVEYIYNQFISVLQGRGLIQVNPMGEQFDPKLHDPLETVEVDDKAQDHTVVTVIQKGYMLHDKLIRAPRVHVGEFKK